MACFRCLAIPWFLALSAPTIALLCRSCPPKFVTRTFFLKTLSPRIVFESLHPSLVPFNGLPRGTPLTFLIFTIKLLTSIERLPMAFSTPSTVLYTLKVLPSTALFPSSMGCSRCGCFCCSWSASC